MEKFNLDRLIEILAANIASMAQLEDPPSKLATLVKIYLDLCKYRDEKDKD